MNILPSTKKSHSESFLLNLRVSYHRPQSTGSEDKMNLLELPLDLIFEIATHLDETDRNCFRSTSRSLYGRIPVTEFIAPLPTFFALHQAAWNSTRTEYLQRLFHKANIYDGRDVAICRVCVRVRPMSRFSSNIWEFGNVLVCNRCRTIISRAGV